jgi:hypothetical protein
MVGEAREWLTGRLERAGWEAKSGLAEWEVALDQVE